MTSDDLKQRLELLKSRIRQVETALQAPQSLSDGLKLQREHTDLVAYLQRLTAQHAEALAGEEHLQREHFRKELETELAELAREHADTTAQIAHSARELAPALSAAYRQLKPMREHLASLEKHHEETYLKRHGNWPDDKQALRQSRSLVPLDASAETELRVIAFALELLDHETTGRGFKIDDLYNALALRSRSFGL